MDEPLGDEKVQYRPAVGGVEVPETAGLFECQSKAGHFPVLTANPGEKEIVRSHVAILPRTLGRPFAVRAVYISRRAAMHTSLNAIDRPVRPPKSPSLPMPVLVTKNLVTDLAPPI